MFYNIYVNKLKEVTMKSIGKFTTLVFVGLISFAIVGCGGSSNTIKNDTNTTVANYDGALSGGDLVESSFNPTTKELTYKVSGAIAGTNGVNNTAKLEKLFGNFYKYPNKDLHFFFSGSLAVGYLELNNKTYYSISLKDAITPNQNEIQGDYNLLVALSNDDSPDICKLELKNQNNQNIAHIGPCIKDRNGIFDSQSCSMEATDITLKWEIDDKKIVFKDPQNNNIFAQALFKKGKQKAMVLDIINAQGSGGIGIALEAKELNQNSIPKSTFSYLDIGKNSDSFGEVTIDGNSFSWKDINSDGSVDDSGSGSLNFNPNVIPACPHGNFKGLAAVADSDNPNSDPSEFALFSVDDGYYISVSIKDGDENSSDDFLFSIGSNKPLK
jgi:hypothetical protein